jgi:hypothetical protein
MFGRIGGQLAREAPNRIRREAQRRRKEPRREPEIQVSFTPAEARALLRFDLDPPPEWISAEAKIRHALSVAPSEPREEKS